MKHFNRSMCTLAYAVLCAQCIRLLKDESSDKSSAFIYTVCVAIVVVLTMITFWRALFYLLFFYILYKVCCIHVCMQPYKVPHTYCIYTWADIYLRFNVIEIQRRKLVTSSYCFNWINICIELIVNAKNTIEIIIETFHSRSFDKRETSNLHLSIR